MPLKKLSFIFHTDLKAMIHCEIFLSEHFMKYIFYNSFVV